MRKGLLFVICICMICVLTGCVYKAFYGNRPSDQPETTWSSADGSIIMYIDSEGIGHGTLYIENEIVEFLYANGPGPELYLYLPTAVDDTGVWHYEYMLEEWYGIYRSDNHFKAIVKNTTFFEEGQKILFYRVDNE